jgi:hypothetical protein
MSNSSVVAQLLTKVNHTADTAGMEAHPRPQARKPQQQHVTHVTHS